MQTTHLSNDERITITHPFHPKAGRSYSVIGIGNHCGKERMLCRDTDNGKFYVPTEYTSAAQNGVGLGQVWENCDFRYDDLVTLMEIIRSLDVK